MSRNQRNNNRPRRNESRGTLFDDSFIVELYGDAIYDWNDEDTSFSYQKESKAPKAHGSNRKTQAPPKEQKPSRPRNNNNRGRDYQPRTSNNTRPHSPNFEKSTEEIKNNHMFIEGKANANGIRSVQNMEGSKIVFYEETSNFCRLYSDGKYHEKVFAIHFYKDRAAFEMGDVVVDIVAHDYKNHMMGELCAILTSNLIADGFIHDFMNKLARFPKFYGDYFPN